MANLDFISLILGAILGVVLTQIYEKIVLKFIVNQYWGFYKTKRFKIYNDKRINNFIFEYYKKQDTFSDLYDCEIQGYSSKIPFLYNSNWINMDKDICLNPAIVKVVDSPKLNYKVNNGIIKKRRAIGQNIFDDDCLYFSKITSDGRIEAKVCSFFQKITLIEMLENETYKAARESHCKTKLRDQSLASFNKAVSNNSLPISLGCQVIVALKIHSQTFIALHKRSMETFTYGGYIASIPVFGLVPIPKRNNGEESENVLLYNILKEYCEELHNKTILEKKENHINPFWFYNLYDEAKELLESLKNGNSKCTMLGYGFDAINGLSILAVLLYVQDENLAQKIYDGCESNWEIDGNAFFCEINDPSLRRYLEVKRYENGTAFALSQALNSLKKEGV